MGSSGGSNVHDNGPAFFASLLLNLKPAAGPAGRSAALESLCRAATFAEPNFFDRLPINSFAPVLVELASSDDPAVATAAARAIALLCDAKARWSRLFAGYNVLPVLCSRFVSIEHMDLAEQCLRALEKISSVIPAKCLKAGVLSAVLTFFNFFPTPTQRVALKIIENTYKKIPQDCSSYALDSIPFLCCVLQFEDKMMVESAVHSLSLIVKNFSNSSQLLDELCKLGLIDHSVQLMFSNGWKTLSEHTKNHLFQLLEDLAFGSLVVVRRLLELKIGSVLRSILTSSKNSHGNLETDQAYSALPLLYNLIPPAPTPDQDSQQALEKKNIIAEQSADFDQFALDVVPLMIHVGSSCANSSAIYRSLSVMSNIIYLITPELLLELTKTTNIASFLSGLLSRRDHHVRFQALKIVEILLRKAPDVYLRSFTVEGVCSAVDAIILQAHRPDTSKRKKHGHGDEDAGGANECYCYASDSKAKKCSIKRDGILTSAEFIKSTFFNSSQNSSKGLTKIIGNLKDYFTASNNDVIKIPMNDGQKEVCLFNLLHQLKREIHGGGTFEFVESGIVRSLANYFSNGRYLKRKPCKSQNLSKHLHAVEARLKTFACMSLSESNERSEEDKIILVLVQKLHDALHAFYSDHFPIIISGHGLKYKNVKFPIRHFTSKHLYVRFVKEKEEKVLLDYGHIIPIELSSSLDAVEEVLWPLVSSKYNNQTVSKVSDHEKQQTSSRMDSSLEALQVVRTYIDSPRLRFYFDSKKLEPSLTLFESILQNKFATESDFIVSSSFWDEELTVTYRRKKKGKKHSSRLQLQYDISQTYFCDGLGLSQRKHSFFSSVLLGQMTCKLEKSNPSYDILFVLKILEGLNQFAFQLLSNERVNAFADGSLHSFDDLKVTTSSIPQVEFVSRMLTSKLEQQMQDSLFECGSMPSWCIHLMTASPFLFSFDTRRKYFFMTLCRSSRNKQSDGNKMAKSMAICRKKYKVNRDNILKYFAMIMSLHGQSMDLIEVEFDKEIGTGRGPTVEFYTVVSREFQKAGLGLWRGDQTTSLAPQLDSNMSKLVGDNGYVFAPFGLFPHPWHEASSSTFSRMEQYFSILGQLVARAILDGRILDLPLSKAFYKVMLEKELDIYDIQSFDPVFGQTLVEFAALVKRKKYLESNSGEHSNDAGSLLYRDMTIEDLCLDFTLPGYSYYDLTSGNISKMVNLDNLEEYVSLVVDATIRGGIHRQMENFKLGINKVFPLRALQIFTEEELERILCGEQDSWASCKLENHIEFGHGITARSPEAIYFMEILQEFRRNEQRAFLKFLTGAPQLPLGGLASLDPKLTIVQKHSEGGDDMELPSVNTCRHFLKLPSYTSKDKMRQKLLYAITEGLGSFHLS